MAVKIRMKRVGTKNQPIYRVVVTDSRNPRDGKFIEELGTYNPTLKTDRFNVNIERTDYWLKQGAQPSDTVATHLKRARRAVAAAA